MFFEQRLLRTLPDVSMLFRHLAELTFKQVFAGSEGSNFFFFHLVKTPSEELTAPQLLIFWQLRKTRRTIY